MGMAHHQRMTAAAAAVAVAAAACFVDLLVRYMWKTLGCRPTVAPAKEEKTMKELMC